MAISGSIRINRSTVRFMAVGTAVVDPGVARAVGSAGLAQVPLDRISLRNMHAVSNLRDQNIEADGCGGQVKIQSYATIRIRTDNGNDTQTLYGEPKDL